MDKINYNKLIEYGFSKNGRIYTYSIPIVKNQFVLTIEIKEDIIKTKIIEKDTGNEYILHLTDTTGEFVGKIRDEYEKVLNDIHTKCFEKNIFKSPQAIQIIDYINQKYGDELEYLWPKFPQNAIWRRKDNKKWYAALLIIQKKKLNIDSDESVEIIDLKASEKYINKIIDNKKIFAGYHMNKKHWITICLDNSLPTTKLYELIDNSYNLAK